MAAHGIWLGRIRALEKHWKEMAMETATATTLHASALSVLTTYRTPALFGMGTPRIAECSAGVKNPSDSCGR